MEIPKLTVLAAIGFLSVIAWYASSVLRTSERPSTQITEVEKYFAMLNGPITRLTSAEQEDLNNSEIKTMDWVSQDKHYFSSQMPDDFVPIYGKAYLLTRTKSPITCGQVKFDNRTSEWNYFIASRRANVALLQGDRQLSDQEFEQIFQQVCL